MSPRQRRPSLLVGALSNWAPLGANIIITFLLWPFLISHLGEARFGVWALAGSFIGYCGLLRLSVGSGIMRYVPFHVGRGDDRAASEVITSGLTMFLFVALIIFVLSMLMAEPIARFYRGGPGFATLIRILGLAAAIECPMRIFDAGLRAQERWVQANSIMIASGVARALGLAGCIYFGYGLVQMGYIILSVKVFALALTTIVFFRFCPTIHLRVSMVKLSRVRELVFFGALTVVATMVYSLWVQGHKLIVGKIVSLEAVTVYAVAVMLVDRVRRIVWAPLQVSWPRFALLDGANKREEVVHLHRRATRYSAVLASGIILLVLVAGPAFIRLWVRREGIEAACPVLIILGIGALVESSLFVNESFLAATGHQRARAIFASIEGVLGITVSILLGLRIGMVGVAIGFVVSVTLVRGLVCTWYVCHLLGISPFGYYVECLLRPWLITGLTAIVVYYSGILEHVRNWPSLIVFAIVVGCVYALTAYTIAMPPEEKVKMLGIMRRLLAHVPFVADVKK